jgi:hypothetical protein
LWIELHQFTNRGGHVRRDIQPEGFGAFHCNRGIVRALTGGNQGGKLFGFIHWQAFFEK